MRAQAIGGHPKWVLFVQKLRGLGIRLSSTDTLGIRLRSIDTTFELLELLQLCRREQFGLEGLSESASQLALGRVASRLFGVVPQAPHLVQQLQGRSSTDTSGIRLSTTDPS
jgi:hypothetical protein